MLQMGAGPITDFAGSQNHIAKAIKGTKTPPTVFEIGFHTSDVAARLPFASIQT